jgi:hypothetical protein
MRQALRNAAAGIAAAAWLLAATSACADEGGVSLWLPGQMGSFSAVPGSPGFSVPLLYYHASVDAGGQHNFQVGGNLVAGIDAKADILFLFPTYVFAQPVAGAQASIGIGWGLAHMTTKVDVVLTGARGRSVSLSASDSVTGGSDLYPTAELKWHDGVHNWMTYVFGDLPTGVYQLGRLANVSINHYALDGGGGYTYLDPKKGHEFTVVGGLTYNWENHDTDYKNGVDSHIDLAASQFINEQTHIGVNGYIYYQLTGDSGSGATLGSFKSRVFGAGPQIGYFFPVGKEKGYVNLRAAWDFGAKNRPEGWNTFLELSVPLAVGG